MTTVLLTNDDGIDAPGLQLLHVAASALPDAEVWTVAPVRDQSARSHAVTLRRPIRVERRGERVLAVDGTSADCVVLAAHALLPTRPDLVLSGVNGGPNLGDDVHYSATTAAAAEAALQGLPAVAVSLAWDFTDPARGAGWQTAATLMAALLSRLDVTSLRGHYLNVNVPDVPLDRIRGWKVCGLGRRRFTVQVDQVPDDTPGSIGYQVSTRHLGFLGDAECDFAAVEAGYVALTPIGLDGTARDALVRLRHAFGSGDEMRTLSGGIAR